MNISIIGMMGSGKSTVAELLSSKLNKFSRVDTDELIVSLENTSINDIFANKGEKYFRDLETRILIDVLNNDNQVISTGGGIVLKNTNLKILKEKSVVFFLSADEEELFERVKNNTERPLLNNVDMREKITQILKVRRPLYEQAHYIIDTNKKSPNDISEEIIRKSGLYGNS